MNKIPPRKRNKATELSEQEALDGEVIDPEAVETEDEPSTIDKGATDDKDLEKFLTVRQKLFCQYYASHEELIGNGVRSYAKAYGIEDKIDTHNKSIRTCANRLLTNVIICRYINSILELKYSAEFLDSQLGLLATQHSDLKIKIEAIKEINKVKGRIVDKTDNTHSFSGPLVMIVKQEELDEKKE